MWSLLSDFLDCYKNKSDIILKQYLANLFWASSGLLVDWLRHRRVFSWSDTTQELWNGLITGSPNVTGFMIFGQDSTPSALAKCGPTFRPNTYNHPFSLFLIEHHLIHVCFHIVTFYFHDILSVTLHEKSKCPTSNRFILQPQVISKHWSFELQESHWILPRRRMEKKDLKVTNQSRKLPVSFSWQLHF